MFLSVEKNPALCDELPADWDDDDDDDDDAGAMAEAKGLEANSDESWNGDLPDRLTRVESVDDD